VLPSVGPRADPGVQGCYAALSLWEINPPPIDPKFNALPLRHLTTTELDGKGYKRRDNFLHDMIE